VFERSTNAIALVDEQRLYVDVNVALCELWGAPRDEIVGTRADRFVAGGTTDARWQLAPVLGERRLGLAVCGGMPAGPDNALVAHEERAVIEPVLGFSSVGLRVAFGDAVLGEATCSRGVAAPTPGPNSAQ